MEGKLRKFTASLIPSDAFIAHGLALTTKVENVLKKHYSNIDRIVHAGSLGKGTEVLAPDVDVVVFLNKEEAPFEKVLEEWMTLLGDKQHGLNIEKMKKTNISLQFGFADSGVKVDLLPATNFAKGAEQQKEAALKDIEKKNTRAEFQSLYAGSLSEAQVAFMNAQSSFTHELVRLGKYWYKTLYLGPKNIYGMKLMLELVAVEVSHKMKMKGQPESLTTAFGEFLAQVSKIDSLKLVDPINKYNILADNFKGREDEVKNLKSFAAATAKKLNNNNADLLEIFQATLPKLPAGFSFVMSVIGPQNCKFNQNMVVRNEEKRKQLENSSDILHAIDVFLVATVNSAAASLTAKGQGVTLKAVEDVIRNAMDRQWVITSAKHEDCDFTYIIPVTRHEDLGAIQISLRCQ